MWYASLVAHNAGKNSRKPARSVRSRKLGSRHAPSIDADSITIAVISEYFRPVLRCIGDQPRTHEAPHHEINPASIAHVRLRPISGANRGRTNTQFGRVESASPHRKQHQNGV